jgi:hypothetical protein
MTGKALGCGAGFVAHGNVGLDLLAELAFELGVKVEFEEL